MAQAREPVALLAPERRFEDEALRARTHEALMRVAFSGRWILGAEVAALEQQLAAQLNVPHALAVKSGTDALLLALMALEVGRGDGVITSVFSFFASASTIARVGATPQLVDICPGCFCIDPHRAASAVHSNTRALLPVHLFGQPAALDKLTELALQSRLALVEDCAQAQGARYGGASVGSIGELGCFSFFPSKNMSALGDGGLVACKDATLAQALVQLRNHGAKSRYVHEALGGNFRLDALQAALVVAQLPALDIWTRARRAHAQRYNEIFFAAELAEETSCVCTDGHRTPTAQACAPIGPPTERIKNAHTFNQYVLRLREPGLRDHVHAALSQAGIGSAVYYPKTLAEQPAFAHVGARAAAFEHANLACEQVLALPIYAQLRIDELERVGEVVVRAVRAFRTRPRQSASKSTAPAQTHPPQA